MSWGASRSERERRRRVAEDRARRLADVRRILKRSGLERRVVEYVDGMRGIAGLGALGNLDAQIAYFEKRELEASHGLQAEPAYEWLARQVRIMLMLEVRVIAELGERRAAELIREVDSCLKDKKIGKRER